MSGHSKWSTIKRQKGINDAKRGQLFSKFTRAITLSAKLGGTDPNTNLKLRMVIDKAREVNMPKENIDRALRAAQGKLEGELQEVVYEGYGPGGVAILVEATTDNRNRTTQEIKNIFEKGEGSMGTPGSVAYQFEQKGLIIVEKANNSEEEMLQLIDLGADDVQETEDGIEVEIGPTDVFKVKEAIEAAGIKVKSAELVFSPKTTIDLPEDKQAKVLKLMDSLDDNDDVQKVWANLS